MPEERIHREETREETGRTGRRTEKRRVDVHEETVSSAPNSTDDLRKRRTGRTTSGFFTDSVRRSSQATSDATGGFLEAAGRGMRAYADSLTEENITRFSLSNGFVEGMLRGYAVFFDELAAGTRRVLDTVSQAPEMPASTSTTAPCPDVDIDYELLAKMVAREILSAQAPPVAPRRAGTSLADGE